MDRWPVCRRVAVFGLRGQRIGEASNPGPVSTRNATRLATFVDSVSDTDGSPGADLRGSCVGEGANPGPGVEDGRAGRRPFRRLRQCRSTRSRSRSPKFPATVVDTGQSSWPPDAQVQDSEEEVPVWSLRHHSSVPGQESFRTLNRFEALSDQGDSNRNVKQRVQATESQENHLLDALAPDLTIEDTDTESMVEEEDIRTQPTRRKLVLVIGRQQEDVGGDTSDDSEGEDLSEPEECEENQSEPGDNREEVSDGEPIADLLFVPQRRSMAIGFASLDVVDLEQVFEVKALVMKAIPTLMKGAFRGALKISLEKNQEGAIWSK